MREIVRGYTTYFLEEALSNDEFVQISSAGASLIHALEDFPELRNALSAPNTAKTLRRDIVKDLLLKKFSSTSASIFSFMAAVEPSSQLLTVINQMLIEMGSLESSVGKGQKGMANALVTPLSADMLAFSYLGAFQQYTSYSQARDLVAGYLEPTFEKIENVASLKEMEDKLFNVSRLFAENRDLVKAIGDPYGKSQVKLGIVSSLFASKLDPTTYRIIRFVASIPRVRDVVGLLDFCVDLVTRERGRRLAEIRAAVPLSSEETEHLKELLEHLVDRKVEIRFLPDQTVLAGFIAVIGDYVIDASLATKFSKLSESLALSL
jgi:F-type H+-transporting ATPase subunit delta